MLSASVRKSLMCAKRVDISDDGFLKKYKIVLKNLLISLRRYKRRTVLDGSWYGSWAVCFTYGVDGGPAANLLGPKYADFTKHVTTYTGLHLPDVEIKHLVLANIALKGVGVFLFIFGSSLGAFLLLLHLAFITPIYNPQFGPLFIKFTENVALFGALIFFIEMNKLTRTRHPKKRISKAKAQ